MKDFTKTRLFDFKQQFLKYVVKHSYAEKNETVKEPSSQSVAEYVVA